MSFILSRASAWSPVIWRAVLYVVLGFLPPLLNVVQPFLEKDTWPTLPRLALALLLGISGAAVALRAFYDGTVQRHADKMNGDTQRFTKLPI